MTAPLPTTRSAPRAQLSGILQPTLPRLRRVTLLPQERDRALVVAEAWQAVCDAGAAGVLVPVRSGGQGGGLQEAVEVARCLSRLGAAVPFLPSAVLATRLAAAAGADGLLAELATGDRVGTVTAGTAVTWSTSDATVSGALDHVVHGADADVWLVLLRTAGDRVQVVRLDRPEHDAASTSDLTRPAVRAVMRRACASPLDVSPAAVQQVRREAEVVRAAEVLAAAEQVLDRDDAFAARLLRAAWTGIEHAAAAADVDGTVQVPLVQDVVRRTTAVAALVAPASGGPALRRWWQHRVSGGVIRGAAG